MLWLPVTARSNVDGTVCGFNAKIVSGVSILTEQQRADA